MVVDLASRQRWPDNFKRWEFERSQTATRYGINNRIPASLLGNALTMAWWLQGLRDALESHYGREIPLYFSSGYRCPTLNKKVRGSKTSAHMKALAVDLHAVGMTPKALFKFIREHYSEAGWDQLILEFDNWVHVGLSEGPFRNQVLIASKEKNWAGKLKTVYKVAA